MKAYSKGAIAVVTLIIGLAIGCWCFLKFYHDKINDSSRDPKPTIITQSEKLDRIHALAEEMKSNTVLGPPEMGKGFGVHTTEVMDLWKKGDKDKVLAMGKERLAKNPDDIAGLLLIYEYHLEFVEIESLLDTGIRLLEAAKGLTTPNFQRFRPLLAKSVVSMCDICGTLTPEKQQTQRTKSEYKGKTFPGVIVLDALERDGLF